MKKLLTQYLYADVTRVLVRRIWLVSIWMTCNVGLE